MRSLVVIAALCVACSPPIEEGQLGCRDGRCPASHPVCGTDMRCYSSCMEGPCATDGGMDAGLDAGVDAGAMDAGDVDGGPGMDGGFDGGPPACVEQAFLETLGAAGAVTQVHDVAVLDDGSVVLVGEFSLRLHIGGADTGLRSSAASDDDAFVARIGGGGGLVWAKRFGAGGDDAARAVAIGPGGDLFVAMSYQDSPVVPLGAEPAAAMDGGCALPMASTDAGDCTLDGGPCAQLPTPSSRFGFDCRLDGGTRGLNCDAESCHAAMVARLRASDGDARWVVPAGDAQTDNDDRPPVQGIAVDDEGRSFIVGTHVCAATFGDDELPANRREASYVAGLSPSGQVLWGNGENHWNFGPGNVGADIGVSSFGVFVAGARQRGPFVSRHEVCGGQEELIELLPTDPDELTGTAQGRMEAIAVGDSAVFAAGYFDVDIVLPGVTGPVARVDGTRDVVLVRLSVVDLAVEATAVLSGGGTERIDGIALPRADCGPAMANRIVVLGSYTDDFDPSMGGGAPTLAHQGSGNDLFLAAYDLPIGGPLTHVWSVRLGGTASEAPGGVAVHPSGQVVAGGGFRSAASLIEGTPTPMGVNDGFAVRTSIVARDGG